MSKWGNAETFRTFFTNLYHDNPTFYNIWRRASPRIKDIESANEKIAEIASEVLMAEREIK